VPVDAEKGSSRRCSSSRRRRFAWSTETSSISSIRPRSLGRLRLPLRPGRALRRARARTDASLPERLSWAAARWTATVPSSRAWPGSQRTSSCLAMRRRARAHRRSFHSGPIAREERGSSRLAPKRAPRSVHGRKHARTPRSYVWRSTILA
jgi:hypothetical protein